MAERTLNLNIISKVARAAGTASNVISGVNSGSFGAIGGALGPQMAVVGTIVDKMTSFAAKANPAAFQQLERVFDDLSAIIGRVFVPVLISVTKAFRLLTDILAPIFDFISKVADKVGEFIDSITEKIAGFLKKFGIDIGGSVGRAPGGAASLVGVGALGDTARQSAYTAGASAPQTTAKNTTLLVGLVKQIIDNANNAAKRAIDGVG